MITFVFAWNVCDIRECFHLCGKVAINYRWALAALTVFNSTGMVDTALPGTSGSMQTELHLWSRGGRDRVGRRRAGGRW